MKAIVYIYIKLLVNIKKKKIIDYNNCILSKVLFEI